MKYRKKPVVIDAIQLQGDQNAIIAWIESLPEGRYEVRFCGDGTLTIPTLEGEMTASQGDWIIRGVKGELYPCKPDIFAATYEEAEEGLVEPVDLAALADQLDEWAGDWRAEAGSAEPWLVERAETLESCAAVLRDRHTAGHQLVQLGRWIEKNISPEFAAEHGPWLGNILLAHLEALSGQK